MEGYAAEKYDSGHGRARKVKRRGRESVVERVTGEGEERGKKTCKIYRLDMASEECSGHSEAT